MISFLWAEDQNHLIGQAGHLPWHLPADLHYFKQITWQHTIIMGHRTFQSFPQGPLPQRRNLILSRDLKLTLPDAEVVHSKSQVLTKISFQDEVFIIGGREIFIQFLDCVKRLYVTKIHHQFEGETYMPSIDYSQFKLTKQQIGQVDVSNPWPYEFLIYQKNSINKNKQLETLK